MLHLPFPPGSRQQDRPSRSSRPTLLADVIEVTSRESAQCTLHSTAQSDVVIKGPPG
jgi:hypothetical protein